jgi:hypothetical protein
MRFNPSSYTWREVAGLTVVLVKFKVTEEAVTFADHFAGRVL